MKRGTKLFLVTCIVAFSQVVFAGIEPVNVRSQGDDLYDLKATSSTLDISDNKYWVMADGFWESEFTVQSVRNKIMLGIDESDMTFVNTTFAYRVVLDVTYKQLVGSELENSSLDDITLEVNYDPARGTVYTDRSVFSFSGGLDVKIAVETIEKWNGTSWDEVVSSTLPSSLFLESEISTERYYPFDQTEIPLANTTLEILGDELKVVWPFVEGAEEYELEWTWVNGYDGTLDVSGDPNLIPTSAANYNFDLNATRVKVSGRNTYSIPLIYGEGYILVRYRGIGRGGENFTVPLDGRWSSDDVSLSGSSGLVSGYGTADQNYIEVGAHEGNEINYGAGMSFIEGGVRSVGVTYMDGVLKPRQSQAKLNGQSKIIVGSTIYDHYGRPAIGVMSTPVDEESLGYIDNLNMHTDGTPYGKEHFDLDATDPSIACGEFEAAPPMSSTFSVGAAKYYSDDNPDKEGYNAYLPDAEGYPFVHVQYDDDPTGRIKRVGGLGPDHQLGEVDVDGSTRDPHYTEYFYTTVDDQEVYELFGNDAAAPANYTKVITKDVHGQLSMAIIDPMGRTIATYMEGAEPEGLDPIAGNDPAGSLVTRNFGQYNIPDDIEGVIEVNTPLFVGDPESVYTFNYDFTAANFSDCLLPEVDLCFDCIYDVKIIIRSDDENCEIEDGADNVISTDGKVELTYTVGSIAEFDPESCDDTPLTFSGVHGTAASTFDIKFPKTGDYQIIKKLVVSESPIDYYWELYKENSTCLLSRSFFVEEALTFIDPTDCDDLDPCEMAVVLEIGTLEMYLDANPSATETEYNALRDEKLEECETYNSCDFMEPLMINDFKEGGQYSVKDFLLGHIASDDASTALLNAVFNVSGNFSNWTDFGSFYTEFTTAPSLDGFYDENGDPSIILDEDLVEHSAPYTGISFEEFANNWRDSWAVNFLKAHPEYCYYTFCEDHPEIFEYEHLMNSVETYAEACSLGLLNPLPIIAPDISKIFELTGCSSDIDDALVGIPTGVVAEVKSILAEDYEYDTGLFYDIYDYAIYISGDDPSSVTFGMGCNDDRHWKAFRSLYFSKRFRIIELLKADYVTGTGCSAFVDCIGVTDGTDCDVVVGATTYYPLANKFPRYINMANSFVDYDAFDWDTYDGEVIAEDAIDDACLSQCEGLADSWMEQLAGCVDGLLVVGTWEEGQQTYDRVRTKLIEVCAGGCDEEWPFPLQVDYGTSTNTTDPDWTNHTFNSFADVITEYIGGEFLECSHLLITNPLPSDGLETLITNLDACACDLILPLTKTEFVAAYGFEPIDFDAEKCQCETYDANNDDEITGAEITALDGAEIFTPNTYPGCTGASCITCADLEGVSGYLAAFTDRFTDLGDPDVTYITHPALFVAYVNSETNGNYTYEQLLELIENCAALQDVAGTEVYHLLDEKTEELRNLLNKLSEGGLTTAQSGFDLYTLPQYLNSSLYPCGDEDVATYDYSPTVGTTLAFGITTEDCTDDDGCVITLSLPDGYPAGDFTDESEVFENIVEFGELYMLTVINFDEYDRFYMDATVNVPGGGTTVIRVKLLMPCYDFITDHLTLIPTSPVETPSFKICSDDFVPEEEDCLDLLIADAIITGEEAYEAYLEEKYKEFKRDYIAACTQVDETFTSEHYANRYHYTLLYYDQSGNLVQTVPPGGVAHLTPAEIEDVVEHASDPVTYPTAVYPTHTFKTTYKHNSLNQVVEVNTPDGGTSNYFYDEIGRLVVSQNAKQADFNTGIITNDITGGGDDIPAYSYTRYDELGRVIEVGEVIHSDPMTKAKGKDATDLQTWLDAVAFGGDDVIRNNITQMHYDIDYSADAATEFGAAGYGETRNRIVATAVISDYVSPVAGEWVYPTADYANHYQYDVHGNVSSYLQEITALDEHNNRYRSVDYDYDLISGNPNYIYYQQGKLDQYIHHYVYDKDNRLKEVFTSADGQVWDRDVNYEYREDGYLARTEMGEMKVQGMDYAYTLHGWLKTLNSGVLNANFDMGHDGERDPDVEYNVHENEVHGMVAQDVLAYTVGYYENDYAAISDGMTGFENMQLDLDGTSAFEADVENLYNGNITSLITNLTDFNGNKLNVHANTYHYDQLHRFRDMRVFTHSNITATNGLGSASRNNLEAFTTDQFSDNLGDYEVHVDYDQNGNITELIRMTNYITGLDGGGLTISDNGMDKFNYIYSEPGTNKLTRVEDNNDNGVVAANLGDIQTGQTGTNYTYHADGSLKSDMDEEIAYIDWYPSGKIKRVYRTNTSTQSDLYFEYDPMGMRTLKVEMTRTGAVLNPSNDWVYTYYAADANGTTMAIYDLDENDQENTLQKTENMLYGGSRLGIDVEAVTVAGSFIDPTTQCNTDGRASFMLEITGPLLGQPAQDIVIELDDTELANMPNWGGGTGAISDIITLINTSGAGLEATEVSGETVGSDYVSLLEIKEITPGTFAEGALVAHSVGGTYVTITTEREFTVGECYSDRELGLKYYELGNHLGNVMEVVSDRKISKDEATYNATTGDFVSATADGIIDHFEADVVQYSDYYPYGMTMPGRNGSISEKYRYAFNGMETDQEVSGSGNSYTTQFRQYDPRLGRWKSREPKEAFYPNWSPFIGMGNNPILFVDLNGLDPIITVHSFSYDEQQNSVSLTIDVELHVKVINGSSEYVDMKKYVRGLNDRGQNIGVNVFRERKSLEGKYENAMLPIDENGQISSKAKYRNVSSVHVTANIRYTFEETSSLSGLDESDNVLILVDEMENMDGTMTDVGGGYTGHNMSVIVVADEDLIHTGMHETTHQAGATAESYDCSSGECVDGETNEVMDMSGYKFGENTIGEIGVNAILEEAGNTTSGIIEKNGGMDKELNSFLLKRSLTTVREVNASAKQHQETKRKADEKNKSTQPGRKTRKYIYNGKSVSF